jgi:hypothetical protein
VDLRAPLDLNIDPVKAAEALERTRIALLGKAVDIEDTQRRPRTFATKLLILDICKFFFLCMTLNLKSV